MRKVGRVPVSAHRFDPQSLVAAPPRKFRMIFSRAVADGRVTFSPYPMGHRAPIVRLLLLQLHCPACGAVQGVDTKMIENQIASVELNRPWIDYAMCKRCQ